MSAPLKTLVTGNAGFIGFHLAKRLLERGDSVVGIDVVNDYYDPRIKRRRLQILEDVAKHTEKRFGNSYTFIETNLAEADAIKSCFQQHQFARVVHLAAQAGVRYSLINPQAYIDSNITAFTNVLEACRHNAVPHFTYASTSSVYGANTNLPFSEHRGVDHPLQFYAATKRANELMAHSYSHLFKLPTTGLRFFTAYGPWGRPDMALFLFTKNIIEGKPIDVFNYGNHTRDFTYVDDIVEGIVRASDQIAAPNPDWDAVNPDPSTSYAPFRIFNIGNSNPTQLSDYISALERSLGLKAVRNLLPLQPGDVPDAYSDTSSLHNAVGYRPATPVDIGVSRFVSWFREFYGV